MTRYELNTNMEYLEHIRNELGELLVDHSVLTHNELLQILYNFSAILYLVLSDMRAQKEKEKHVE